MDVVDLMRILLRRWYLVLPVVSLVAVAAFTYSDRIEPEYNASGSMVLLPPASVAPEESLIINPWQSIGTDATVAALSVVVQSESFAQGVATEVGVAPGDTFSYEVLAEDRSAVVTVEATAESAEQAIQAASIVKAGIQAELDVVQEEYGIPAELRTTFRTLDEPGLSEVLYPGQLQVRIAGLAAGLLLALVIALLGDRVLFWVGRRRRERAAAAAEAAAVDEPAAATAAAPSSMATGSSTAAASSTATSSRTETSDDPARPRWQVHSPVGDSTTGDAGTDGRGAGDGVTKGRPADDERSDARRTPVRSPGT